MLAENAPQYSSGGKLCATRKTTAISPRRQCEVAILITRLIIRSFASPGLPKPGLALLGLTSRGLAAPGLTNLGKSLPDFTNLREPWLA